MVDQVLVGKILVSVCFVIIGVACACLLKARHSRFFALKACSLFIIVRIGLFIVVFIMLKFQVQSDAVSYYDWATLVNRGHVPGASELVPLHYGPLFLYIIAFLIKLWD